MNVSDDLDAFLHRIKMLEAQGLSHVRASHLASLERRVASWPSPTSGFDGYLYPVLYGDFSPPKAELSIPALDLTIFEKPLEREALPVRALCILRARIAVDKQTVAAVQDAAERLDLFTGAWVLAHWGNSAVRWWSEITHGDVSSLSTNLDKVEYTPVLESLKGIGHPKLRERIGTALFWIQEPQRSIVDAPLEQSLRRFMAYWTALECLITGVVEAYPSKTLKTKDKQLLLNETLASWKDSTGSVTALTPQQVEQLWRVVDPGLKVRAQYVFGLLFSEPAKVDTFIYECFERPDTSNRLYQVRNDIAHGNISASDPVERHRVESRERDLFIVLWNTFGALLPVKVPNHKALSGS